MKACRSEQDSAGGVEERGTVVLGCYLGVNVLWKVEISLRIIRFNNTVHVIHHHRIFICTLGYLQTGDINILTHAYISHISINA